MALVLRFTLISISLLHFPQVSQLGDLREKSSRARRPGCESHLYQFLGSNSQKLNFFLNVNVLNSVWGRIQ